MIVELSIIVEKSANNGFQEFVVDRKEMIADYKKETFKK